MKLYLVRHGRSLANEEGLVPGTTSDVLSISGIQQAKALKVWLDDFELVFDRFITSHWHRARQTAEIIVPDVEWEICPEIGETDAGAASERKLSDFLLEYPDFYGRSDNCYPDGESHDQLNNRVEAWLERLLASCHKNHNVLVVAHSGPLTCILQLVLQLSMEKFPVFLTPNASMTIINFDSNKIDDAKVMGVSLGPTDVLELIVKSGR